MLYILTRAVMSVALTYTLHPHPRGNTTCDRASHPELIDRGWDLRHGPCVLGLRIFSSSMRGQLIGDGGMMHNTPNLTIEHQYHSDTQPPQFWLRRILRQSLHHGRACACALL
eukprot:scaffold111728_cov34-Tisochrysis_lutea.AAC.1